MSQRIPPLVKLSVNVTTKDLEALRKLAERSGHTMTHVLRCALGTELFLQERHDAGAKIVIIEKDGEKKEIVFR